MLGIYNFLVYLETGRLANPGSIAITLGALAPGALITRTWKVKTISDTFFLLIEILYKAPIYFSSPIIQFAEFMLVSMPSFRWGSGDDGPGRVKAGDDSVWLGCFVMKIWNIKQQHYINVIS